MNAIYISSFFFFLKMNSPIQDSYQKSINSIVVLFPKLMNVALSGLDEISLSNS